jgi:hypothetical protein
MKRGDEGYVDPRRAPARNAVLAALPGTRLQIAERSGVASHRVVRVVAQLHQERKVHIARWVHRKGGGVPMPVFAAGAREDAPESLPRMTRQQIWARYEQRVKGTEMYYRRKAQRRALYWAEKAASRPNSWASALFAVAKQRGGRHA